MVIFNERSIIISMVNNNKFEVSIILTALLCLAVIGSVFVIFRSSNLAERWRDGGKNLKNFPPGPKGWPIVGSLYSLGPKHIPACQRFASLAEKYGPVMFLWMGARPTLVVSNSEMAMAILKTYDQNFASRPLLASGKHLGYNYRSVVFSPSGEHFRRMKKIYTCELLSPTKVELMSGLRWEEVRALLASVFRHSRDVAGCDSDSPNSSAGTFDLTSTVFNVTLNIVGRMVLCKRLFGEPASSEVPTPPEVEDFKCFVKSATRLVGLFNIGDYIPALRWLDLQGVEAGLERLKPHREGLLVPIIQEYRKRSGHTVEGSRKQKEDGRVNFITSLLASNNELSDDTITAVAIDLIVGGSESVSATIDWTLAELLRHPHYLQEVQDEIDSVVSRDRLVEEVDIPKLPFLNCVLKECLRLHPPAPLAMPHASVEECTLGGYRIPKNTTTYINLWAIGRDPKCWENPNQFNPKRFIDSKVTYYGQDYNFLPFSSGRRGCPGVHVAVATLKLILANLLHCFNWSPPPGVHHQEIDMADRVGVVCARISPLLVSVTPRVATHVILDDQKLPPNGNTTITSAASF